MKLCLAIGIIALVACPSSAQKTLDELEAELKAEYEAKRAALLLQTQQAAGTFNQKPQLRTAEGSMHITATDVTLKSQTGTADITFRGLGNSMSALESFTTEKIAGQSQALSDDMTIFQRQTRQDVSDMSAATLEGINELGTKLQTAIVDDVKGGLDGVTATVNEVKASVDEVKTSVTASTEATGGLKPYILKTVKDELVKTATDLKAYIGANALCSTKGQIYDEKTKKCKCQNPDHAYVFHLNRCGESVGIVESKPGKDCGDILGKMPGTADGQYWIKPDDKQKAFRVYCDMSTEGGGWTLIESYDIPTHKSAYSRKPFQTNFPRNEDKPPASTDSGDRAWDDYRLSISKMAKIMERGTQMHARCHRDYGASMSDYMFADISAINKQAYSGTPTKPYGSTFNMFSMRGRIRNMDISQGNWNWYHGSPWHAGFDIGSKPGATSSEDSFTWHDCPLNSNHKCHTSGGDTAWFVRSFGGVGQKENPGQSCYHILKANPTTAGKDGPYWLKLASGLQRVYCEMSTHGGGWTMFLSAKKGEEVGKWNTNQYGSKNSGISKQTPKRWNTQAENFKLKKEDINGLLNSWKTWGNSYGVQRGGNEIAYWTTTPGSGQGFWGAEIFHKSSCQYNPNRKSGQIKGDTCHQSVWDYKQTTWFSGGHWWDNSGCYQGWGGYSNEGNHGTGSKCYATGRGLGYHCSGYTFHRGWCGTASWGVEFVRG